jgi:hypothetical protein
MVNSPSYRHSSLLTAPLFPLAALAAVLLVALADPLLNTKREYQNSMQTMQTIPCNNAKTSLIPPPCACCQRQAHNSPLACNQQATIQHAVYSHNTGTCHPTRLINLTHNGPSAHKNTLYRELAHHTYASTINAAFLCRAVPIGAAPPTAAALKHHPRAQQE